MARAKAKPDQPKPKQSKAKPPKAKRSTRQSPAKSGDPIQQASEAARAGDYDNVLDALLAAWADVQAPELAALIATATTLAPPTATGLRGKTAAARSAWLALAKLPSPREVPALLEALADGTSSDGVKRLALVAKWPRDPRVDAALVGLLETVPYRATSTQPFWRALWPLLGRISAPALVERLRATDAFIAQNVAATMGAWLRNQVGRIVDSIELAVPVAPRPSYTALAEQLAGAVKASAPRDDLGHLLQAIYDAPDDDGPRLVYADALLERGDPRGELIALQCRPAPLDREQRKREKALLDAHGMSWLGPLSTIVMAGYRFERGFLAACRVDNDKRDLVQAVVGHPSWATVRELRGSAAIALHPVMRSLRALRFDPMNALHAEKIADPWKQLLVARERPIEKLYYDGLINQREWVLEDPATRRGFWRRTLDDTEIDALFRCGALPKLRELVIAEEPTELLPRIWTAPVLKRLDTLGFVCNPATGNFTQQQFASGFLLAPVPTLTLELRPDYHTTHVRLERDASSTAGYERLWMQVGPTTRSNWSEALASEAIALLQVMPPSLKEVRIETRKNFEAPAVERVRAAAAALPRLAHCEVG